MFDDFTAFKEELKTRIDIIDVVGEYTELKKSGSNYVSFCPFHNEKAPSFSVNRSGQFYHCFGCGKGGDVIGFLMDISGMSFMEAVEQLAERAGLEVPKRSQADSLVRNERELLSTANHVSAEYFHRTLYNNDGKAGMDYLLGRGLTSETIKKFHLGYATVDSSGLLAFAKGENINLPELKAAGILLPDKYGGSPYNRFGGRAVFPIIDQAKRIIGFGARLLEGEGAKYINSSETLIYRKSNALFGIYQAKDSIKRTRKVVVVEGYMDVISLYQAGITNVIATSGTAFTVDQGRIISRMVRDVTLLFDGDSAGLSAAARGADNLLVTNLSISVAVLPESHDPDSYIRDYGADALRELLDHPMDLWEFKLEVLGMNIRTVEEKNRLAGEIADSISLIPDNFKRDLYIQDMSPKLGIDVNSMYKAVNGRIRKRSARKNTDTPGKTSERTQLDRELLASIILYPHLARRFMEEAGSKPFTDPVFKLVAEELFHRIVEGMDSSPSALISALSDRKAQELIAAVAMIKLEENTASEHIKVNIKRFREREISAELLELGRLIKSEKDMGKKIEYNQRQQELIKKRLKVLNGTAKNHMSAS